jgi:transposase
VPKSHPQAELIPLTVPEVRRLILALAEPPERFGFRLAWSAFRRHHQAVARRGQILRRSRRHLVRHEAMPAAEVLPSVKLTDAGWAALVPLLSLDKPSIGRPADDHRRIVEGILWVQQTGRAWRQIPQRFGSWSTVYSRYRRWSKLGTWQRIVQTLRRLEVEGGGGWSGIRPP